MKREREKAVGKSTDSSGVSLSVSMTDSEVCSIETYVAADSETMSFMRRSRSSAPFLTDNSESAPSFVEVSGRADQ